MKKTFAKTLLLAVAITISQHCHSQSFTNMNFEATSVTPAYPPGTVNFYATSVAIPGWAAYLGGVAQSTIPNDGVSTGGAMVSLQDTNAFSPYPPIQGVFSVLLLGTTVSGGSGNPANASISLLKNDFSLKHFRLSNV